MVETVILQARTIVQKRVVAQVWRSSSSRDGRSSRKARRSSRCKSSTQWEEWVVNGVLLAGATAFIGKLLLRPMAPASGGCLRSRESRNTRSQMFALKCLRATVLNQCNRLCTHLHFIYPGIYGETLSHKYRHKSKLHIPIYASIYRICFGVRFASAEHQSLT